MSTDVQDLQDLGECLSEMALEQEEEIRSLKEKVERYAEFIRVLAKDQREHGSLIAALSASVVVLEKIVKGTSNDRSA